ncbi:alpha/beta hydrolase [Flammeovirga kamogawensis]|uniref:Alpha/beta hydrolase n=1 Tax=Flammeovirga kamogawensis TaxID=373891 RepID=A0ABX8GTZ5_9BACT|nr:alpha/beta hydrolase [Flammeovirga kamogawensis]MBB6460083.1 pimeloyl-ACP methyl ester carboxylesterase [Flammeovirga kamogawensis]QWG06873.1 alpha/beta hydrolase [Flammeovirga kamogawensis]TRX68695.1 alpha/beta hydrolase [Flammeovirga kamogawensis]
MNAYCISGLGADQRVYNAINISASKIHLEWITPFNGESLEKYAIRLGESINTEEDFILIGVSFGGTIALEIAKYLHPKKTFLISSIDTYDQLPIIYRMIGEIKLISLLPVRIFNMPYRIAKFLFGTRQNILKSILKDTDATFVKWAINALLTWRNKVVPTSIFKINGDKDLLLKAKYSDFTIKGGHHFMIVDRGNEISTIINNELRKLKEVKL